MKVLLCMACMIICICFAKRNKTNELMHFLWGSLFGMWCLALLKTIGIIID